jgi:hypothetical protein
MRDVQLVHLPHFCCELLAGVPQVLHLMLAAIPCLENEADTEAPCIMASLCSLPAAQALQTGSITAVLYRGISTSCWHKLHLLLQLRWAAAQRSTDEHAVLVWADQGCCRGPCFQAGRLTVQVWGTVDTGRHQNKRKKQAVLCMACSACCHNFQYILSHTIQCSGAYNSIQSGPIPGSWEGARCCHC